MAAERLRARLRALGTAPNGRRGWMEWIGVLAICALISILLIQTGALRRADNIIHDAFLGLRSHTPDDRLVIAAIDNRSLEALGRWPWPRETHARLIDRLTQAGVAATGFDVLFTEPAPGDEALAAALKRSGRTCLPMAVDPSGRDGAAWQELRPVPALAEAAAGLGQVNLAADDDGIVRRAPLSIHAAGRRWDHMMTCVLNRAGQPFRAVMPDRPRRNADLQDLRVASLPIDFPGRQGAFRTVSYVDVLNGELPADLLKDRIVLIGMTGDGQGDRYAVAAPRGEPMPGVEIQAALADTLMSGRIMRTAPNGVVIGVTLAFLSILMVAFLILSPRWGLGVALVLGGLAILLSAGLFRIGLWLPPLGVLVSLVVACPLWSWRRLATTSAYLDAELRRLIEDSAVTPGAHGNASDDVVSRQVAAVREAVARLRGMNRFVSDTLASLPDAAVVADEEDRIVYANPRARTLFGDPDLIGADLSARLARLHPELTASQDEGLEVALPDGRALRLDRAALDDGTGGRRIVRLADVTAMRAAERQREEALQLLGHDMRAPQTAILTLVEGGQNRDDPRLLTRIADYARMTLRLADGYVQLARAEAGPLTRETLDLREIVIDAADILWPASNARQVRIALAEGPEVEVEGDRSLMTRALMNLLDNAIKHSPTGSEVAVSIETEETTARVMVADSGPGLTPDQFERFLQPFQHGADRSAGAGLGLAFVARVAARHGGALSLGAQTVGSPRGAVMILEIRVN